MRDTRRLTFRQLCASITALLLASASWGANEINFNIPADVFPKAMLEFYHQSKVEILFLSTNDLYRIHTQAVKGELSAQEALKRLLSGTGLIYEFDSDHSVIIKKPGQDSIYFDIPAGIGTDQLNEWARQARAQLLFDFNVVKGFNTRAVKGSMSRIDALLRMLSGLPLVAAQVDEQTYAVDQKEPDSPDSARFHDSRRRITKSIQTVPPAAGMDEILIASNQGLGERWGLEEPRVVYDRTDIDARGASSLQDFTATIPQVWGGGPNEYSLIGREGLTNSTAGTGFDYRAQGAESAVVLVDGIRPAKSGTEAGWWDVSLLPLSAIDRIEIVPDGASIRYGLDAISAVANFITRSDFTGAETQAQLGGATDGGGSERRVSQLLGKHWGGGNASLIVDYYDRDAVPASERGQATSDLRRWGATNWNSPYGYPGTLMTVTGQTWAITGVSGGKPVLGPAGSSNNYDLWQSRDVLPWQQRVSALGHASVDLGDVQLWSSVWVSNRHSTHLLGLTNGQTIAIPSTNPGYINPLGQSDPVYVAYGFSNWLGPATSNTSAMAGSAAAGLALGKLGWTFEFTGQTGFERDRALLGGYVNLLTFEQALTSTDSATVLNPFSIPLTVSRSVLNRISHDYYYQSYSRLQSIAATASRNLRITEAADTTICFGAEYRQESFTSFNPSATSGDPWQSAHRSINSIYASLNLPLLGKAQSIPDFERLDLSVGSRYEHYSDGEAATAPSVSLIWSPFSKLTLRGAFRQGFRPPALTEKDTSNNLSSLFQLPDGRTAIAENGGNPDLRAERARVWTGGIDFAPIDRMLIGATYYTLSSFGRVVLPTFSLDLSSFNGSLVENPSAAQRATICRESLFLGGSLATCEQTPAQVFMDARLQSLEHLTTSGIDLTAQYRDEDWKFRFDAAYLLSYRGVASEGALLEQLGILNNPVDLRFRATAARSFNSITLALSANYTDSYRDTYSQPPRQIASWTTMDLSISYEPRDIPLIRGTEFLLGIHNLMDQQPPFANDGQLGAGWDPANGGSLEGRVISGQIHWAW